MDTPNLYFTATAVHSGHQWSVLVTEYFGEITEVVVPTVNVPYENGLSVEPWQPLIADGWQVLGPARFDMAVRYVDVEPPYNPNDPSPIAGEELTFVRRCRARGMPSVTAMREYRRGERSVHEVIDQWRQTQSLMRLPNDVALGVAGTWP